jgi:hypothetical protein
VALTDVEIIRAHFITAGAACDMIPFNSIVGKIKKINYKFTQVLVNEPLDLFLRSMTIYLQNNMHCNHLHRAKIQEMFVIFKFFYTPQIQLRTFYNLFDRNQSFASLVRNNAPRVKTIEELADNCRFFKAAGFEVGAWIWTFWIKGNKSFRNMRSVNGKEIKEFMCPTDESFVEFARNYIKDIARCGVDIIQFDDDFRYGFFNNSPACLCDGHISELAAKSGIPAFKARAVLSALEVKGLAVGTGGNRYTLV